MNEPHDIMRDSQALRVIQEGIPANVEPAELRKLLHAYRDVVTTLIAKANEALDRADECDERIDHRQSEITKLTKRLFDSEEGVLRTYAKRSSVAIMTGLLLTTLGALVVASIMLALNLATGTTGATP